MRRDGFTLVELTIAMAIASLALVIMMSGIIQLYHMYQKDLAIRQTQQASRAISTQLTADIQTAAAYGVNPVPPLGSGVTANALCLFNGSNIASPATTVYYVHNGVLHRQKVPSGNLTTGSCTTTPATDGFTSDTAVSDNTVNIRRFVASDPGDPRLVDVSLSVAAASDTTDIDPTTGNCLDGSGTQNCSVTTMEYDVMMRNQ